VIPPSENQAYFFVLPRFVVFKNASVTIRYSFFNSVQDLFDENQPNTIGVDFKIKFADIDGKRVKLTIWDTAGQERFRTLTSSYYRGAQGIILAYDVSRRDTFESLDEWLNEIEIYSPNGGANIVKILVGNKVDRDRTVPREEGEEWARDHGMIFLETSAKENVSEIKILF